MVTRSNTRDSRKQYNNSVREEGCQEREAGRQVWSMSMHHGRQEQEYYDGHMRLHKQNIIGGGIQYYENRKES